MTRSLSHCWLCFQRAGLSWQAQYRQVHPQHTGTSASLATGLYFYSYLLHGQAVGQAGVDWCFQVAIQTCEKMKCAERCLQAATCRRHMHANRSLAFNRVTWWPRALIPAPHAPRPILTLATRALPERACLHTDTVSRKVNINKHGLHISAREASLRTRCSCQRPAAAAVDAALPRSQGPLRLHVRGRHPQF